MIALILLFACGGAREAAPAVAQPQEMGLAECAVCGMVVREQPAPRGQVAYRDGQHEFVCSIGDLRALLEAPSPRGAPAASWVEAVPSSFDPLAPAGPVLPWIRAEEARYVVGFERPQTMGVPTLSAADGAAADDLASRLGGRTTTWEALRQAPFHQAP